MLKPDNQNQNGDVPFDEIRELSKRQIEAFEHWSRRLIDDFFREAYSEDYLDATVSDGQPLIKAEIRDRIRDRKKEDPGRYPRDIDAILLEDIEYFLSREDLYSKFFKQVLEPYLSGRIEVRRILNELIPIRNKLYHDNAISIREAEKVLCYTNDFIDAYKAYYINMGKEREFNVPVILSLSDSQGNRVFRKDTNYVWTIHNINPNNRVERSVFPDAIYTEHRSGDHYEIELDVDSSFSPETYNIYWSMQCGRNEVASGQGNKISIDFTNKMVAFDPEITVQIITNKEWHRFAYLECDDKVEIKLSKVFPPIEDTY